MPFGSRKRRTWILAGGTLVVAAVILWRLNGPLRSSARRAWRDQAVATIQKHVEDKAWLDAELARLKPQAATRPHDGGWVGDEVLLMRNGDWIVCQNVCTKEQNTPVRKDLFIGRGSDGKWYYSTFHFCVRKFVLQIERQPESLAQFVDGYWLAQFDGKSDESLKVTWERGPYGEDKIRADGGDVPVGG